MPKIITKRRTAKYQLETYDSNGYLFKTTYYKTEEKAVSQGKNAIQKPEISGFMVRKHIIFQYKNKKY